MLSIHDLPPAMLELCWAPLSLCERHRAIPLVCHAWRQQLNSSPQLLQAVTLQSVQQRSTTRFRSFYEWMVRWAVSHVERLELTVLAASDGDAQSTVEELAAMLPALLSTCAAAGALRELRLVHSSSAKNTAWLAGMRQLRLLHLAAEDPDGWMELFLEFDPPAWSLAGLKDLCLVAQEVTIPSTAHLPTSLTRLRISGLQGNTFPSQIASLAELRELSLAYIFNPSSSFVALAGLSGLRRIALDCCMQLPACLPSSLGWRRLRWLMTKQCGKRAIMWNLLGFWRRPCQRWKGS